MTSLSAIITVFLMSITGAESQNLKFITDHLAAEVLWQEHSEQQILAKGEATQRLGKLCRKLREYKVDKIHDAKWNASSSTYGVVHLRNNHDEYRLFFLYQKNQGKFEIVKLRLTEI
jgi:hypothetical protein